MPGAPYITAHQLKLAYGPTQLFEGLSLTIHPGERWGIVGPNGAGKSTLLKILIKEVKPDQGTVSSRSDLRLAYVSQKFEGDTSLTARQLLTDALPMQYRSDTLRESLEAELNAHVEKGERKPDLYESEDWLDTLSKLQEKLELAQGVGTENLMTSLLKLGDLQQHADKRFDDLSGGLQKRVQILTALLPNPQIILLDEPTNHLDVATVEWLEEFLLGIAEQGVGFLGFRDLASEPFSFVIVSHDRALLDTLVNRILEIEGGLSRCFEGNFEKYSEQRLVLAQQAGKAADKAANLYRRELAWLRRGAAARSTKQQARIDRAGKISDDLTTKKSLAAAPVSIDINIQAELTSLGKAEDGSLVTKVENLGEQQLVVFKSVSLPHPDSAKKGAMICSDLSLVVKPGTRLALLGPNGCGKTTLLKAMVDPQNYPHTGEIHHHELTRVSYFDQHRAALDPNETVKSTVCPEGEYVFFGGKYLHVFGFLERFLFDKFDGDRGVLDLSGGEQARLLLAKLMLQSGNLLVLDEPTNDLDIPTLQTLEANLLSYRGGVIFTSHDRYFIERVATQILSYEGTESEDNPQPHSQPQKKAAGFKAPANLWQVYPSLNQALAALDSLKEQKKISATGSSKQKSDTSAAVRDLSTADGQTNATVPTKKLTWAQKQAFDSLELRLPKLENDMAALTVSLDRCYSEGRSFEETQKASYEVVRKQAELDAAYAEWEQLYEIQNR